MILEINAALIIGEQSQNREIEILLEGMSKDNQGLNSKIKLCM